MIVGVEHADVRIQIKTLPRGAPGLRVAQGSGPQGARRGWNPAWPPPWPPAEQAIPGQQPAGAAEGELAHSFPFL